MHSVFKLCRRSLVAGVLVILAGSSVSAQIDRVYTDGDRPTSGKISAATRDGIVIRVGGTDQKIPVSEISHLMYQGDPSGLTKGRVFAIGGQYDQAISELKTVDVAKLERDVIREDLAYYTILCDAKIALSGNGNVGKVAADALKFLRANNNSIHFFATTAILGDLALGLGEHAEAAKYYGYLKGSSAIPLKVKSAYLVGTAKLAAGDFDAAGKNFKNVMSVKADSVSMARMVTMATAGQAVVLANTGKVKEGVKLCQGLIDELSPADTELAAMIYNAHGKCLEATEDSEGAIFAYLHTHLMFSGDPQSHAVALKRLIPLWTQVGKPERANSARQELRQRYPGLAG